MSDVSITAQVTSVGVSTSRSEVGVNVSTTPVTISIAPASAQSSGLIARYLASGSDFSGGDGDTGRTYAFARTLSSSCLVTMGNGVVLIPTTQFTVSGATLTIVGPLYNDEVVLVWL